jgi:hypothetical protein
MRSVFGAYVLDPQRYELYCVGKQVLVRPTVCEVLAYLLAHRDRQACAHPGGCLPIIAAVCQAIPLSADRPEVAEARQLLAGVYGWFTEGFAMADLQEARMWLALLEAEQRGKMAEP